MRAPRHALIIEDELISGLGLQGTLEPLGFESFAFASTPMQALEQARMRRPDLITADVGLLHGAGPEAVDSVISLCGPTPVIFVTGDPVALAERPGAVIVRKPFGASEIAQAYARLFENGVPAEGARAAGA